MEHWSTFLLLDAGNGVAVRGVNGMGVPVMTLSFLFYWVLGMELQGGA